MGVSLPAARLKIPLPWIFQMLSSSSSSTACPFIRRRFRFDPACTKWISSSKPSATIETVITKNNQEVKKVVEQSTELANAAAQMTIIKTFPTSDFEPGQYAVQIRVTDNLTKEVVASKDSFVVR